MMAYARQWTAAASSLMVGLLLGCGDSGPSNPGGEGSTSSTTTGGSDQCKVAAECPGTDTDCQHRTCTDGICGLTVEPAGAPTTGDTAGPCMHSQCDGKGFATQAVDDTKLPDDGNPCTADLCTGGTPSNPPRSAGTPCSQGQGVQCNGQGACVECLAHSECSSGVCTAGMCAAPSCSDGVTNGAESDLDCGGGVCPPCGNGLHCAVPSDCTSASCKAGVCTQPSCADGVMNGAETDFDCGGGVCSPCGNGLHCSTDSDCTSTYCKAGVCTQPSCADGVMNGTETDLDCGGSCVAKCADGLHCTADVDCTSTYCKAGVCTPPSCSDGVTNGTEADLDCGGTCATKCVNGKHCGAGDDCASTYCKASVCTKPTCIDGDKNGLETDIDCGGPCVAKCGDGKQCAGSSDCQSKVCTNGVCQPASCSDRVQNGQETGLDCGGSTCTACPSVVLVLAAGPGATIGDTKSFGAEFASASGWSPTTSLEATSSSDLGLAIAGTGAYLRGIGVMRFTKANDAKDNQLYAATWTPSDSWTKASSITTPPVTTREGPSITSSDATVYVTYHDLNFKHNLATLTGSVWSTSIVGGSAAFQSSGPTPAGIAAIGSTPTIAFFTGNNNNPTAQDCVLPWSTTLLDPNHGSYVMSPAIVALSGSAEELMVAYIDQTSGQIFFLTRTLGTWSTPAAIANVLAQSASSFGPVERVGLAPLPAGGALLAYRDKATAGIYTTTYSGGTWTAPAAFPFASPPYNNPLAAPSVAHGIGNATAELAFVGGDGVAYHARLIAGTWTAPATIGGKLVSHVVIASAP